MQVKEIAREVQRALLRQVDGGVMLRLRGRDTLIIVLRGQGEDHGGKPLGDVWGVPNCTDPRRAFALAWLESAVRRLFDESGVNPRDVMDVKTYSI